MLSKNLYCFLTLILLAVSELVASDSLLNVPKKDTKANSVDVVKFLPGDNNKLMVVARNENIVNNLGAKLSCCLFASKRKHFDACSGPDKNVLLASRIGVWSLSITDRMARPMRSPKGTFFPHIHRDVRSVTCLNNKRIAILGMRGLLACCQLSKGPADCEVSGGKTLADKKSGGDVLFTAIKAYDNETKVCTGDSRGDLMLWDLDGFKTARCERTGQLGALNYPMRVEVVNQNLMIASTGEKVIRAFDPRQEKFLGLFEYPENQANITEIGSTFFMGNEKIAVGNQKGIVRIFDLRSKKWQADFDMRSNCQDPQQITTLDFKGSKIAVGTALGKVDVFNLEFPTVQHLAMRTLSKDGVSQEIRSEFNQLKNCMPAFNDKYQTYLEEDYNY